VQTHLFQTPTKVIGIVAKLQNLALTCECEGRNVERKIEMKADREMLVKQSRRQQQCATTPHQKSKYNQIDLNTGIETTANERAHRYQSRPRRE
jgi:hypothetical protein